MLATQSHQLHRTMKTFLDCVLMVVFLLALLGFIISLVRFLLLKGGNDLSPCRHDWVRTNDAVEEDVPDSYPPAFINYVSPRRSCRRCNRHEWYVGPEVCGGDQPRWVEKPDFLHTQYRR